MRFSHSFISTRRDVPADAEVISHQLMIRAGMIRKIASGIYTYLPLGYRVIKKVEDIIREEMNAAGAQELLLPIVMPAQLWRETGRWDVYGKELLRSELSPEDEALLQDLELLLHYDMFEEADPEEFLEVPLEEAASAEKATPSEQTPSAETAPPPEAAP